MSLDNGLHTVREVWLGETQSYFIPSYQRGYKWTVQEVRKLLEDIKAFSPAEQLLPYYCLQNITVKNDGDHLNVIDGQQRLTTTLVILSFFKWKKSANVKAISSTLIYGVREETRTFLADEIISGKIWESAPECADEVFLSHDGNEVRALHEGFRRRQQAWQQEGKVNRNHSDVFHLYCAALTVRAFFNQGDLELAKFESKFLDKVEFLVNNVAESMPEPKMFSKINGFRVPLDGADLLRAIFVTDVARMRVERSGESDSVRREIRLAEERVKLGLALDDIAAWWSDPAHKDYFKLLDDSIEDVGKAFDAERYPINHLYKLYEAVGGRSKVRLEDFEEKRNSTNAMFEDVLQLQSTLRDWHEDRYIYHFAGYLCTQCGWKFRQIFRRLKRVGSRRTLYRQLKTAILNSLVTWTDQTDEPEWKDLDKKTLRLRRYERWLEEIDRNGHDWYGDSKLEVGKILVLLDVIAFTRAQDAEEQRFHPLSDHMDAAFFEIRKEDKEHIFPQTPIGGESLKDKDALRTAVREYWILITDHRDANEVKARWRRFWSDREAADPLREREFLLDEITDADYEWLVQDQNDAREKTKKRINEFVASVSEIDLNSIGNVVLLNSGTNRSYGNDFYPKKRQRIMSDYRQNLSIRLHTRSVFAKEFPKEMDAHVDPSFDAWTQASIVNNRRFIKLSIKEFFQEVVNG